MGHRAEPFVAPLQELLGRMRVVAKAHEGISVHVRIEIDRFADRHPLLGLGEFPVEHECLGDGDVVLELESWRLGCSGVRHCFHPLVRMSLFDFAGHLVDPRKPALGRRVGRIKRINKRRAGRTFAPS